MTTTWATRLLKARLLKASHEQNSWFDGDLAVVGA